MRAMHEICLQLKDVFIIEPRDRVFTDTPIAHATAAVHMVIEYMLHGCTLAMQPIFGTQRLLDDIRLLKPNHILASPSQHKPLSKRSDLREGELSFVKRVFSGAEKLYESDYNKLDAAYQKGGVQTHLLDACGMSEYGTMTLLSSDSSRNWMLPVPTTEHRLHDEEGNVIVGDGVGRHHTRTPARMLGYLNNPEGTAEFFDSDGWGDNGDITESKTFPDGRQYLDVLGRDSDMTAFTSREGKRIYGLLVDRLLLNNPDILEAQTVALPVAGEAEAHTLATYIVFEPDADGDQKERLQRIVAECRKEFGGLLLPTKYQILERMPQNGTTHKRDIPLLATGYGDFTDIDEIA